MTLIIQDEVYIQIRSIGDKEKNNKSVNRHKLIKIKKKKNTECKEIH